MAEEQKYSYNLMLPAMGEGIIEATITKWLVSVGQLVTKDQPLVEVATDKVDSEIPSPVEGTVLKLIYREGEIPRVGEVIALIGTSRNGDNALAPPEQANNKLQQEAMADLTPRRGAGVKPGSTINASPLVRMLAKQRGLETGDLRLISGTGENGEISREDINRFILEGKPGRVTGETSQRTDAPVKEVPRAAAPVLQPSPDDEVVEMDRMRKLIASHMIASKQVAAHVTSFLEADVTSLVLWREQNKDEFYRRENSRLTFTPVFIEAVTKALKEFPRINVSVSGESIIMHKSINIGIATALADGNLIVPVIRNADRDNLGGLARKLADLAGRARSGSLLPEDIRGGTFTITNIGQYNNLTGTPIINQPESAILAFGTIMKKPWAVKTAGGYGVAVRDIIMLALSYDHRVIDGALGGSFLSAVANNLENSHSIVIR